jgi:hypothetical protein
LANGEYRVVITIEFEGDSSVGRFSDGFTMQAVLLDRIAGIQQFHRVNRGRREVRIQKPVVHQEMIAIAH